MVVTISGTTISTGSQTYIESSSSRVKQFSLTTIDTNKVVVAYGYGNSTSSYNLYVRLVKCSGDSISNVNIYTTIDYFYANSANTIKVARIEKNKFFLMYYKSGGVKGIVIEYNDSTGYFVTKTTSTLDSSSQYKYFIMPITTSLLLISKYSYSYKKKVF